ncbi:hypothetical protein CDL15_Pgr025855 [Punica granatum]|nr:hypothetical protein CDL15_Pgr025855 [Punica granatum]
MDSPKKCLRVILFPVPLQGHINPLIQLAGILYSRGFSISIIQFGFNSINPSTYPHFNFHSILPTLSETDANTGDVIAFALKLNCCCFSPFRECFSNILSDTSKGRIACLITDAAWYFTQAIADEYNIRRLAVRTTSICSFLAFAALPLLREKGYIPLEESRLEEPIPELTPCKIKDIHMIKSGNFEDIFRYVTNVVRGNRASSGLIWNTFEDLERAKIAEFSRESPAPVFPIGPFHKYCLASSSSLLEPDKSSLSWLEKQATNSVIYVSFGSLAVINEKEFQEIGWGLVNSKQPFLWVVRPGLVPGVQRLDRLLEGFLKVAGERGLVVKWAPQQAVLAHQATGGFWTHGGWNSTLESICEGVPMICQPAFGDQRVNTRYVSDVWRVGIHLENRIERGEIQRTIRRLMGSEEGEEMRGRIRSLKEKGEACLRPGGASYKSLDRLTDYISEI